LRVYAPRFEYRTLRGFFAFLLFTFSILLIAAACAGPEIANVNLPVEQSSDLVWPRPPQTPRIRFVRTISRPADVGIGRSWFRKTMDTIMGTKQMVGAMLRPYGVFARGDRIYVTDPGISLLHVIDVTGKKYFQIRKAGKEMLISPIGVTVDEYSNIYLTDSVLKKVFEFDKGGKLLKEIGLPGLFLRPTGIAANKDRIYVIDTLGHKVFTFSKNGGKLLFHFGKRGTGKGEFNYPTNIFIGKDGLLYITDSMNFRVQIFDTDGNFLSAFGKEGDGSGDFSRPKGIAVDSEGHIYVADTHFDTIQIFDRKGNLLLGFGETGRRKGKMVLPAGIFIDNKDRIYVADSYNNRIQIFQYLKAENQ
jgi:DNA-binding beta-propeller fold protein YncE